MRLNIDKLVGQVLNFLESSKMSEEDKERFLDYIAITRHLAKVGEHFQDKSLASHINEVTVPDLHRVIVSEAMERYFNIPSEYVTYRAFRRAIVESNEEREVVAFAVKIDDDVYVAGKDEEAVEKMCEKLKSKYGPEGLNVKKAVIGELTVDEEMLKKVEALLPDVEEYEVELMSCGPEPPTDRLM